METITLPGQLQDRALAGNSIAREKSAGLRHA